MIVTSSTGTATDIQTAVDTVTAAGGGIVYVPAGVFTFTANNSEYSKTDGTVPAGDAPKGAVYIRPPSGGISIIGAGTGSGGTILMQNGDPPLKAVMFLVYGQNVGNWESTGNIGIPSSPSFRFSNIFLSGSITVLATEALGCVGILIDQTKDFRVDHCYMINFGGCGVNTGIGVYGQHYGHRGVIDHCYIGQPYHDTLGGEWGYGVSVFGDPNGKWANTTDILGLYHTGSEGVTYVEDCIFYECRHAIASNASAHYVFRHNHILSAVPSGNNNIDAHNIWSGPPTHGTRMWEVYNNIIGTPGVPTPGPKGVAPQGGSGTVFNNDLENMTAAVDFQYYSSSATPAVRPYGTITDAFCWGNTYVNNTTNFTAPSYVYGVDYSTGSPTVSVNSYILPQLGSDPIITYTPYTYPHPLAVNISKTFGIFNSTINKFYGIAYSSINKIFSIIK